MGSPRLFSESFTFNKKLFGTTLSFKIYDRHVSMPLGTFCDVIGTTYTETSKKISGNPRELVQTYQDVTNEDTRSAQRGKISNIQFPAIKCFAYYIATSVLGRENTSNISNLHLAFLTAALKGEFPYNLGTLIARHLAARG